MAGTHLVAKPSSEARTRKRLAPSRVSGPLVFSVRRLSMPYLWLALRFRGVEVRRPEAVLQALRDFQEKRTRLIIAFRHPYGDEPQLLFHVFENLLPRLARRQGAALSRSVCLRPVHDYAVALWGGAVVRYILPRVGAVPVYHSKVDTESLRQIRNVMRDGPCPLGIAPEGQISYHAQTLPRIEQGTVRMGFWCASDLEKAGRTERVAVLPLSIHYRYHPREMRKIVAMLSRVEALCGLENSATRAEATPAGLCPVVERIEARMLSLAEQYYQDTYGYRIPNRPERVAVQADMPDVGGERGTDSAASGAGKQAPTDQADGAGGADAADETGAADAAASRHARWLALQPFALSVAEHALGIDPGPADNLQRMYRVRQEGWDRVYPESPVEGLAPLQAALADRRAGEAWYAMRHMELVDLMEYHDPAYFTASAPETLTFDRLVETVYTLHDLACRLMGGNITNRPNRLGKTAVIVPGELLDLTQRLPEYHAHPRRAVQAGTEELIRRFKDCLEVYRHG